MTTVVMSGKSLHYRATDRGAAQLCDSTTSFYHHDALGSTLALTDGNEAITDTCRYYAFGGTLTSSGSTINPYQYVGNLGYYNEPALSMQYLRARYYQPSSGRFVSIDPTRQGPSWYVYASNKPLSFLDPSGKICRPWWTVHYDNTYAKLVGFAHGGPCPLPSILGKAEAGIEIFFYVLRRHWWYKTRPCLGWHPVQCGKRRWGPYTETDKGDTGYWTDTVGPLCLPEPCELMCEQWNEATYMAHCQDCCNNLYGWTENIPTMQECYDHCTAHELPIPGIPGLPGIDLPKIPELGF